MNETRSSGSSAREVVGVFSTRENFENAVEALVASGVQRSDLSVLSSHESLEVAGRPAKPWKDALTAMVGEIKYEGPLVASGAILLAGGTTAAAIAGVIGAAVSGVALKEVLDEVTAKPHTEAFSRALEAGSIILWVHCIGEVPEANALKILEEHGGANVHIHDPTGA